MGHGGQPLWRRSSMCGNENECLEVAVREDRVFARDSKQPRCAPLSFTARAWTEFLGAVVRAESYGP
ncbi:DUF397 domain-containing protein [Streptomyces sp. NPDC096012]|uniref:DUF397 domain-containing protein n=1 Tax=Streptomyces sp. NPDC096012 TaxID=3155684 RepID=UPI00336A6550